MIDFRNITKALHEQIQAYNTENYNYTITRNKAVNTSDSVAVEGWIGIYRDSIDYSPNSTGPTPWLAEVRVRIEIQAASFASEEDCEEKLDDLILFVERAIESDRTIGGNVLMVTGYDVDYDDNYAEQIQTYYQFATITVAGEVKA